MKTKCFPLIILSAFLVGCEIEEETKNYDRNLHLLNDAKVCQSHFDGDTKFQVGCQYIDRDGNTRTVEVPVDKDHETVWVDGEQWVSRSPNL